MRTSHLLFLPHGILALCLLLAGPNLLAADEVYKWVDDEGVTHYGTRAPTGREASSFTPKTGHSEPVKYDFATEEEQARQRTANSDAQNSERVTEPDPERCQAARNNLKALSDFGRVKVKTDDGGFRYLEREEMQERIEEAKQVIAESC